jgi:hypothetical protein
MPDMALKYFERVGIHSARRTRMTLGKITLGLTLASCFVIMPAVAFAQNGTTPQQDVDKSADVRTFTGCLQHADKPDQYKLALNDGSTWMLRSDKFKLSSHVGHTITVTGNVWHPELHSAKERAKEGVNPNAPEKGTLTLTDLSTVSRTCQK